MNEVEFDAILLKMKQSKTEKQTLELKTAAKGCPGKLYDTLSSFSNQADGGTIIFGIDEKNDFAETGVYDSRDLQQKIMESCNTMQPVVRPLISIIERNDKNFVVAEIPGIDLVDRPCFYRGAGRLKGSYVRVGDADLPMTEYEVYAYEAFRRRNQDDIRVVESATVEDLDMNKVDEYLQKLRKNRPNLKRLERSKVLQLMGIVVNGRPTVLGLMLFGLYPQIFFPQLCVVATAMAGTVVADEYSGPKRFIDNKRIEGTIPEMLQEALLFLDKNYRHSTDFDYSTGMRADKEMYPQIVVREAIINALVHRDYSLQAEATPVQIKLFYDRLEVINPGGVFGALPADMLGKVTPFTRNPRMAVALEVLGVTENRYSGIPLMQEEMKRCGQDAPVFKEERGHFKVTLFAEPIKTPAHKRNAETKASPRNNMSTEDRIVDFCRNPKSRKEICEMLQMSNTPYVATRYLKPLLVSGRIRMTIPDKPQSRNQKYVAA